jgi:hypothetical protein
MSHSKRIQVIDAKECDSMIFYDDISKDYDDIFPISKDAVGFIKVSIE